MKLKGFEGTAKALTGLALLVLVVIGAIAYFSDSVSLTSFVALAFILTVVVMALSFFGWVRGRGAAIFAVTAAILVAAVMFGNMPQPNSGQYQAVFLTNGQVYFGHLKDANSNSPRLTNIYYLQSQAAQPSNSTTNKTTTTGQTQLSLVKLGNELHGPEDEMVLKSNQILFWENLKNDSKVVTAIKNQK